MPFASVRDIDLYYELHGDGPPLLMISGTGNDLRVSHPEINPLNKHFTIAHFDQRGLGQSGKPDQPYTMGNYADDAAGLLDHLGWDRAHVMGISFGGMVAQNLVVRHPERVDRMVLSCTSPGGEGGASADLLAMAALAPARRADASLALTDTRYVPGADTLPPGMDFYAEFVENRPTPPPGSPEAIGARGQLEARSGHDVYDNLAAVDSPTLVIGGRFDGIAPPANLAATHARLPNSQMVLCDGGHLFLFQDPSSWQTILAFLDSDRTPSGDAATIGATEDV